MQLRVRRLSERHTAISWKRRLATIRTRTHISVSATSGRANPNEFCLESPEDQFFASLGTDHAPARFYIQSGRMLVRRPSRWEGSMSDENLPKDVIRKFERRWHPNSLRSAHVEPPDERLKHLTGTSDAKPLPLTAPRCRALASAPRILSASLTESLPGLNAPCAISTASPTIRTPFEDYLVPHSIVPAICQACPAYFRIRRRQSSAITKAAAK